VDAIIGKTVILAPYDVTSVGGGCAVALEDSGSSANVALMPGTDSKLTVRKSNRVGFFPFFSRKAHPRASRPNSQHLGELHEPGEHTTPFICVFGIN
jgi:hypothetical protein